MFLGDRASIKRHLGSRRRPTAIFSDFGGYFFGNFRDKASVVIQDMQLLVGFSVIPKCISLNDPELLFHGKFWLAFWCEVFRA